MFFIIVFFILNMVKRQRKWMRFFFIVESVLEFMEEMLLKLHFILKKPLHFDLI